MLRNKLGMWLTLAILCTPPVFAQVVSFAQATQDYTNGKYAQALSEFETYRAAYPTNVQVHYYEALCYQALGRLDKARGEYDYVVKNDGGRLKLMAQQALAQLSRSHAAGGSSGSSSAYSSSPQLASASSTGSGEYKVRKVIEFYADW
jgi:tetratricopeptide (TPR) repeat protein